MTIADRIAAVLDRRSVLLAFCALPFAILLIVDLTSRLDWQTQSAALRRENLSLELRQLSSVLEEQSVATKTAIRVLAETDGFSDWAQEIVSAKDALREPGRTGAQTPAKEAVKDPGQPRLDLKSAEQNGIDAFFVESLGAGASLQRRDRGRTFERARSGSGGGQVPRRAHRGPSRDRRPRAPVSFLGDEFIAARPIVVRGSGAVAGWLAATRHLSSRDSDAAAGCDRRRAQREPHARYRPRESTAGHSDLAHASRRQVRPRHAYFRRPFRLCRIAR